MLQKYALNDEEKHIHRYIHSDNGLKSDETTMEKRGLNLDKWVRKRAFQDLPFE